MLPIRTGSHRLSVLSAFPSVDVLQAVIDKFGRRRERGAIPECAAYLQAVLPVLDTASRLYASWLESTREERDQERLANMAAVLRWELAGLLSDLMELTPPAPVTQHHRDLAQSLGRAVRAAHMLAYGYRFCNFGRLCDGQTGLQDSMAAVQRTRTLVETMGHARPAE